MVGIVTSNSFAIIFWDSQTVPSAYFTSIDASPACAVKIRNSAALFLIAKSLVRA